MTYTFQELTLRQKRIDEVMPYELLLLADPSKKMIDEYVKTSTIYLAERDGAVIGLIVLYPLSDTIVEIKNVAVREDLQGQGIGLFMLKKIQPLIVFLSRPLKCNLYEKQ